MNAVRAIWGLLRRRRLPVRRVGFGGPWVKSVDISPKKKHKKNEP
jgi:hypothetical protein